MKRVTLSVFALAAIAPIASADILFQTDFTNYALGTVDGQFGWSVTGGPTTHGVIADVGGSRVLRVAALGGAFGGGSQRNYDTPSTRRYVQVSLDFSQDNDQWPFWFMDNFQGGTGNPPDAIFWEQNIYYAANGNQTHAMGANTWYHIGIEIDTQLRGVIGVNFGNGWVANTDSSISPAGALTGFNFAGYSFDSTHPDALYWLSIDNIVITDSDAPLVPSPSAAALLGVGVMVAVKRKR